jgi:hypothetical protein
MRHAAGTPGKGDLGVNPTRRRPSSGPRERDPSVFFSRGVAWRSPGGQVGSASATTRRDCYASPPRCVHVASAEAASLDVALTVISHRRRTPRQLNSNSPTGTDHWRSCPPSARSISSSFRPSRGCRLVWPGEEVWLCAVGCCHLLESRRPCRVVLALWGVFATVVVRFTV